MGLEIGQALARVFLLITSARRQTFFAHTHIRAQTSCRADTDAQVGRYESYEKEEKEQVGRYSSSSPSSPSSPSPSSSPRPRSPSTSLCSIHLSAVGSTCLEK